VELKFVMGDALFDTVLSVEEAIRFRANLGFFGGSNIQPA
jgi:hypothetical protein